MSAVQPIRGPQFLSGFRDGFNDGRAQAMTVLSDDAEPAYRKGYRDGWKSATTESPLARICREADEHRAYVIANPDEFTTEQVQDAQLAQFQHERLEVAAILRYGD